MKKTFVLFCILFILITAFSTTNDALFRVPKHWPKPANSFSKNSLTANKVQLGRVLFYDPILSRDSTISCSSCHSQYTAFAHVDHPLSHGIENNIGSRNAPVLFNLAWQRNFMWDGSIEHLDMQSLSPISNPLEMDETMQHVTFKLKHSVMYPALFYKAYGDSSISTEKTLNAISQFMLSLISADSKYDSMIRHQVRFTVQEENGYAIFKQHCSSCHTEPLFTNHQFENNGLLPDPILKDVGRMKVTQYPADSLKFKVPTLRNIEFSYPYMHDGRFKRLSEVLTHYTTTIQQGKTLSPQLQTPIVLTSNEKVDLIAFLLTLTDKHFLFNPDYSFPKEILLSLSKESK